MRMPIIVKSKEVLRELVFGFPLNVVPFNVVLVLEDALEALLDDALVRVAVVFVDHEMHHEGIRAIYRELRPVGSCLLPVPEVEPIHLVGHIGYCTIRIALCPLGVLAD